MAIGDALAAPLHWIYTLSAAREQIDAVFGGCLARGGRYEGTPPAIAAAHPDSWRYFQRCDPAREPVDIFGGRQALWRVPGTSYHATLPAGDNTLSARLVTLVTACAAGASAAIPVGDGAAPTAAGTEAHAADESAGWNVEHYFAAYVRFLTTHGAHNNDTWVDEAHRVLIRNVAAGAAPHEAGLNDCCLTGLALATPLALAYARNPDASDAAIASLLQLSHKSPDMLTQAAMWSETISALLVPAVQRVGDGSGERVDQYLLRVLRRACDAFSGGRVDLQVVEAMSDAGGEVLSDVDAFHGHRSIFSLR